MNDIINDSNNKFDLLKLSGWYMNKKKDKYRFNLLDSGNDMIAADEIYKIIDPSNDQAFKTLFKGITINNLTGLDRAQSLIQSLLYKFKDKYLIKNCQYMANKIPEIAGKNIKNFQVLDCPFLCEMTDNLKYIIDLEIQNYYFNGLDLNMFDYATSLRNYYNLPVIAIVLLFKDTYHGISPSEIQASKRPLNETNFELIDDNIWVLFIDLYYIVDCLDDGIEPNLDGLELSQLGKEWIKLLTIKHWMPSGGKDDGRYPIPKNLSNSKEIISAIMILDSNNNFDLTEKALKEKERAVIINQTKIKTIIKIWINAFLKGKIVDIFIVDFPKVSARFLIEECKMKLDKDNCLKFIKILIDNQIIIPSEVYQKLINEIYN